MEGYTKEERDAGLCVKGKMHIRYFDYVENNYRVSKKKKLSR